MSPGSAVRRWLWAVYGMIVAIIFVGGVTRLTGSGLSMTDWRPLMGTLPPMSVAEWQAVFAQYQQSPQFQQVNSWMDLSAFKRIFFWEYLHRLLGRLIGLVVLLPGLWFLIRGQLRGRWAVRAVLAFVFGGLQGLLGWYMVKSGLVDVPAVSHFRLAAHLSLAFFVGAWIWWMLLDLYRPRGRQAVAPWAVVAVLGVQIVWGAFVAGSRAGYLFQTWPDMNGMWVPSGPASMGAWLNDPIWLNFLHRSFAWVAFAAGLGLAWQAARAGRRRLGGVLAGLLVVQMVLGIGTVLTGVSIGLAAAHQVVAFLLLSAALAVVHAGQPTPSTSTSKARRGSPTS